MASGVTPRNVALVSSVVPVPLLEEGAVPAARHRTSPASGFSPRAWASRCSAGMRLVMTRLYLGKREMEGGGWEGGGDGEEAGDEKEVGMGEWEGE